MNKRKALLAGIGIVFLNFLVAQNLVPVWDFDTGSKAVTAAPLVKNNTIYVGNGAGVFYAIDLSTGQQKWKFDTKGNIQAKAVLFEDKVFFESANVFYALNVKTGKEVWRFNPEIEPEIFDYQGVEYPYKLDPFDNQRSAPTLHEGVIYVGTTNGKLYGLDQKGGRIVLELSSDNNSPIRSSPLIAGSRLYFGDWSGKVYCYDFDEQKIRWKKKTYHYQKPYFTFGGVVSSFSIHGDLLYFGARNYTLNVLDAKTGERVWSYTDPEKGWIISDPVVYNDTLYIGGSDNFTLYAFSPSLGNTHWASRGERNIIAKPVVTEKWVIYASGNGYNTSEQGMIAILDRMTGEKKNQYYTPQAVFSAPVLNEDQLIYGCHDGKIYCIELVNP